MVLELKYEDSLSAINAEACGHVRHRAWLPSVVEPQAFGSFGVQRKKFAARRTPADG